jgi:mono-ADP-ribosyltransferase sirtuin 6
MQLLLLLLFLRHCFHGVDFLSLFFGGKHLCRYDGLILGHNFLFNDIVFAILLGIPDFRGPDGVWTLRAQGKVRTGKTTPTLKAIPTATHMAIKELLDQGVAKFLVSQNTDGLHRRSGVDPTKLAELHGNSNLERCETCGKDYLRDFHTRSAFGVFEHYTGRLCSCGGKLSSLSSRFHVVG